MPSLTKLFKKSPAKTPAENKSPGTAARPAIPNSSMLGMLPPGANGQPSQSLAPTLLSRLPSTGPMERPAPLVAPVPVKPKGPAPIPNMPAKPEGFAPTPWMPAKPAGPAPIPNMPAKPTTAAPVPTKSAQKAQKKTEREAEKAKKALEKKEQKEQKELAKKEEKELKARRKDAISKHKAMIKEQTELRNNPFPYQKQPGAMGTAKKVVHDVREVAASAISKIPKAIRQPGKTFRKSHDEAVADFIQNKDKFDELPLHKKIKLAGTSLAAFIDSRRGVHGVMGGEKQVRKVNMRPFSDEVVPELDAVGHESRHGISAYTGKSLWRKNRLGPDHLEAIEEKQAALARENYLREKEEQARQGKKPPAGGVRVLPEAPAMDETPAETDITHVPIPDMSHKPVATEDFEDTPIVELLADAASKSGLAALGSSVLGSNWDNVETVVSVSVDYIGKLKEALGNYRSLIEENPVIRGFAQGLGPVMSYLDKMASQVGRAINAEALSSFVDGMVDSMPGFMKDLGGYSDMLAPVLTGLSNLHSFYGEAKSVSKLWKQGAHREAKERGVGVMSKGAGLVANAFKAAEKAGGGGNVSPFAGGAKMAQGILGGFKGALKLSRGGSQMEGSADAFARLQAQQNMGMPEEAPTKETIAKRSDPQMIRKLKSIAGQSIQQSLVTQEEGATETISSTLTALGGMMSLIGAPIPGGVFTGAAKGAEMIGETFFSGKRYEELAYYVANEEYKHDKTVLQYLLDNYDAKTWDKMSPDERDDAVKYAEKVTRYYVGKGDSGSVEEASLKDTQERAAVLVDATKNENEVVVEEARAILAASHVKPNDKGEYDLTATSRNLMSQHGKDVEDRLAELRLERTSPISREYNAKKAKDKKKQEEAEAKKPSPWVTRYSEDRPAPMFEYHMMNRNRVMDKPPPLVAPIPLKPKGEPPRPPESMPPKPEGKAPRPPRPLPLTPKPKGEPPRPPRPLPLTPKPKGEPPRPPASESEGKAPRLVTPRRKAPPPPKRGQRIAP